MQQNPPPFPPDEIQRKINALRQARGGIAGNPEADWREAIRLLEEGAARNGQRRNVFSLLNHPFVWVEKRVIEPTANWLDRADFFLE